jgi:hypothetical protein
MLVLLTATRPERDAPATAAAREATSTAIPTSTATPTALPPTATTAPAPSQSPVLPTVSAPASKPVAALSGVRLVDTVVVENHTGGEVFLPPGMPVDILVGAKQGASGRVLSFYIGAPPPFAAVNGTAGTEFNELGGTGTATGTGFLQGVAATFTLEFFLTPDRFEGTMRISEAATGKPVLLLHWRGGSPVIGW